MSRTLIRRYDDRQRLNHWAIVLVFFFAFASGFALFHPSLYFLSVFVGGGQWARILHPYLGLLMVLGFVFMFAALWRDNRINDGDRAWLRNMRTMLRGHKDGSIPVGKYNAGQKLVFWGMSLSLLVLLVTGFLFWWPWFAESVPIPLQRVAVVLHAVAAVVLVLSVIVHVYAAIWVKGTIRAMTRGTVTESWARRNHAGWHAEQTGSATRTPARPLPTPRTPG